jgi:voltage-gated potassium channel
LIGCYLQRLSTGDFGLVVKQLIIKNESHRSLIQKRVNTFNLPLALLSIAYLAIYSALVVFSDNNELVKILTISSNFILFLFVIDLAFRFLASSSIKDFLRSSWLEIIAVTVPFLRMFRMLRVLVAVRGLTFVLSSRAHLAGLYIAILVPTTWFMGAISVLDAEATHPEATITTLGIALWWSLTTIATVGYGEVYPTTIEGKVVAGILMATGIALFSTGAGIFASWVMGEKK